MCRQYSVLFPKSVAVWFVGNMFKMLNSLTSVWDPNRSEYLETPHPTITHRTTRIFKYTFSPLYGDDGSRGVFPLPMFGTRSSSLLLLQLDVQLLVRVRQNIVLHAGTSHSRTKTTVHECQSQCEFKKKCRELFIKSHRPKHFEVNQTNHTG